MFHLESLIDQSASSEQTPTRTYSNDLRLVRSVVDVDDGAIVGGGIERAEVLQRVAGGLGDAAPEVGPGLAHLLHLVPRHAAPLVLVLTALPARLHRLRNLPLHQLRQRRLPPHRSPVPPPRCRHHQSPRLLLVVVVAAAPRVDGGRRSAQAGFCGESRRGG